MKKRGNIFLNGISVWKGKIWFFLNMICTVLYLVWRVFFTIPFGYGTVSVVAGILLLVVEVLGMAEALVHYANMSSVKGYPLPEVPEELYPDVDVFIATYSEDCELLYKTINGCKYMEYPDKSKVHIYLCDDNRRPEMRELAAKMGVNYLDRPDNKGAKAGNLNHALEHSNSPYILTLDADMIPKSDFLMKTIPYFVDCEIRNKGRKEEDKIKLDIKKMQEEYDALNTCREELNGRYKSVEKEVAEARKQLENVMKYMGMEQEERKEKKHSRRLEKEI